MPLCAVALSSCSSEAREPRANNPRPAVPITISVMITEDAVRLAPKQIGAGPVELLISNRSMQSQRVVLKAAGGDGSGEVAVRTTPISPQETSTVPASVKRGRYELRVGGGEIEPGRLQVGAPRKNSSDKLLTP